MLTLTNRIDMRPGAVPLVIHLGQYDSNFSLVFELYSSAGNFTVESGTTAMIRGTKTDGNAYDADATIDVSAKTVTVAGSEQMTAAKGRNVYELVLTKSGKVLSTANFILDVERAAMDADTIASESVLKELNAIIAGAETATEAADRAEDAADSVSSASAQIATNTADIADLKADFEQFVPGLSDEAKAALLACFQNVAWAGSDGQSYYDDLYEALYNEAPIVIPDISLGAWQRGATWNSDGSEGTSNYQQINRTYYPVSPETEYMWVQGFSSYNQSGDTMVGVMNRYRVCVYDADKNFIGYISNDDDYNTDIAYIEPRYFVFTTPQNAAFIRISCQRWPVGFFARRLPDDIYCVIYAVGKLDDSNFVSADFPNVESAISVSRDNEDITIYAKTGCKTLQSIDTESYSFARGEFAINSGANAEGGPATRTNTRYLLVHSMLLQEGDVISVNGLKVAIWAQKLTGGTVQHTSSWLTTGDTFTIGGA